MQSENPAIVTDNYDEKVVEILRVLDSQYNTKIIYPKLGQISTPYDACLISVSHEKYHKYGPWKIWDAPHTIPAIIIPEWVKSPLIIIVNRDENFRKEECLGIGKRLENVYRSKGVVLPCGEPSRISRDHLNSLREYRDQIIEVLQECPLLTLEHGPQRTIGQAISSAIR